MTDPEVDPILALLPWYLSGKLQPSEADRVRERLAQSEAARRELESLIALRRDLVSMLAAEPMPSPRVRDRIQRRIRGAGRMDWLADASRRVFAPKWMPAAASAISPGACSDLKRAGAALRSSPAFCDSRFVQRRSGHSPWKRPAQLARVTDHLRSATS